MAETESLRDAVRILVPTGMLGSGIRPEHIQRGVARGAHAIATDSGSTDSGPSYLARGVSKMNREAIRQDLEVLMAEASGARIPLLVGSCGTSGTDSGVDWTAEIAIETAQALGIAPRIACLYSEQSAAVLIEKNRKGMIAPLPPSGPTSEASLASCEHIVALMGPEPYIAALKSGADVVLGGRTTDTAVLAAVPLMMGAGGGPAWHAAKVSECGDQCTGDPKGAGVLMSVGSDAFDVEPLDPLNACTPTSVSAHLLYENSDPYRLVEPGGVLDVTGAEYFQLDERATRVSGSVWAPAPYTMKLEGARRGPFQTIMLIGIEDPEVLANLEAFEVRLADALTGRVRRTFPTEAPHIDISLRLYGWNGVSGMPPPAGTPPPREVGVMFVATAPTQDLADRVARACNPLFFHMPLRPGMDLPSYAFPFTPAEIPRGPVYEFVLNHVVQVADPMELVRIRWIDVVATGRGRRHA